METRTQMLEAISAEVARAEKHGTMFHTAHEAYGVIFEEVEEFWEIVRQKKRDRDPTKLREELIQIAAMAVKGLESLDNFWGGSV